MEIVFYVFAALLIWLSFKSFLGGIEYVRFFRSELAKPPSIFTPFISVIAPCRGVDEGLEENLAALLSQGYPNYEIIFAVDDRDDPAFSFISQMLARRDAETQSLHSQNTQPLVVSEGSVSLRLIVAPKATTNSQKCENLREAVRHSVKNSEVLVFVDSDARPSPSWLCSLVAPLADKTVGAATGYRWYISENPTLASELRSAWNASIASAFGPNTESNFCWGGSTAIRREVFDRLDIREKWRHVVSDDFAVTRAMNDAGLPIVFVPQALTASVENCTFLELIEFTTRQMKITRVYAPRLWVMSLVGSAIFCGVLIAAFLIVMLSEQNDFTVLAAWATIVLVAIFSTGKSWLRLKAVRLVLTAYKAELRRQAWTQLTFWALTPALFFYNCVTAWISRRITWRGTTYELKSDTETVIISD